MALRGSRPSGRALCTLGLLLACAMAPGVPRGAAAAVFVVTSTGDGADLVPGDGQCDAGGGACTLRAAIVEANAAANEPSRDEIHFDVPGAGPHVIAPASPLPAIEDAVAIDGYTQPGSLPNQADRGFDAAVQIVLSGTASTAGDGLDVLAGASLIRGVAVGGWQRVEPGDQGNGIRLRGDGSVVEGCILGSDAGGTADLGNDQAGVLVEGDGHRIGGGSAPQRNLISGNVVVGVDVEGNANRVIGNLIGLGRDGAELENGIGVRIDGEDNTVGSPHAADMNVVSGNVFAGIEVLATATGTEIHRNLVGTDVAGEVEMGNGSDGIQVRAPGTVVGGIGTGNLVSGNERHGINLIGAHGAVVRGNFVGSDIHGAAALGNRAAGVAVDANDALVGPGNLIAHNGGDGVVLPRSANQRNLLLGNAVRSNGGLGIDLQNDNVTQNDADDGDTGANGRQNFPQPSAVESSGLGTTLTGTLASAPDTVFLLELFGSDTCDASGFGEGAWFVDSGAVQTDGTGLAAFALALDTPVGGGRMVTVTATGPDGTSEYSACIESTGAPATTTTTTTLFPATTITTSTVPGGTTTTTLPGGEPRPCDVDADCADDDACTVDACGPGGLCVDDVLDRVDGVLCHVENIRHMMPDMLCTGRCCRWERRLQKLERRYVKGMAAGNDRQCRRGLGRGRRQSRKLERKITKQVRRGCVGPDGMAARLAAEGTALNAAAERLPVRQECAAR